jgi:phosphinothricin acetyltransferase
MKIREATTADLAVINDIYCHYVQTSTCTYETEPSTAEERATWFARHGAAHPVTVAEEGAEILGWASLSPFNTRCGYRFTVEDSVYVKPDRHRRGIGSTLLADLVLRGRAAGHRSIVAGISADQEGSIALHRRVGFEPVALLRQVGHKFGRWLDLTYLQLLL